jgi:hypothetical protein
MGIEITSSGENIGQDFVDSINKSMQEANRQSADYMRFKIRLSYDNRGFLDPKSKRDGAVEWEPTTYIAKKNRKTYPKSSAGQKKGKKGLTQKQARYLFVAPTLVDTGKLRGSITEEEELFSPMELNTYTGASVDYIETHEEGGTYKGRDVPARPSQYITEPEIAMIEKIFERAFNSA